MSGVVPSSLRVCFYVVDFSWIANDIPKFVPEKTNFATPQRNVVRTARCGDHERCVFDHKESTLCPFKGVKREQ